MSKLLESLKSILESIDELETKLDLKKEIIKNDKIRQETEPVGLKKDTNPLLRKIEEIENGEASLEELKELVKKESEDK